MSGVEVAGLILGAIPICSLALKGINQSTTTIERFRKWRDKIPTYVAELELVRIRLRHSLRLLFTLVGRDLPNLDQPKQDKDRSPWKDTNVAQQLRRDHREIYIPFERDVFVIQQLLQDLCKKLGLGPSVNPQDLTASWATWSPNIGFLATLKNRIEFCVYGNQISKIIDDIKARQHDINGTLMVVDIIARRTPLVNNTTRPGLTVVRQYAGKVHGAFDEALKCTTHSHGVRLLLDLEPKDFFDASPSDSFQAAHSFRLCVSSTLSSQLCFADVSMHDKCNARLRPINGARPEYLLNLCPTVQRPIGNSLWIGLVLETQSGIKLRGTYEPMKSTKQLHGLPVVRRSFVSFHELLQDPPRLDGRPWKIPEKQRRSLSMRVPLYALILASTAWRSELWRGADIQFLKDSNDNNATSVDLARPFVTHRPSTPAVPLAQPLSNAGVAAGSPKGADVTRLFLIRLGLLLMEIGLGETIDMYRQTVSTGKATELSESKTLALLDQWKHDRNDDLSDAFNGAIEFCLVSFLTKDFLLEQDKHWSSVIEKVVLPWTREYKMFAGIAVD